MPVTDICVIGLSIKERKLQPGLGIKMERAESEKQDSSTAHIHFLFLEAHAHTEISPPHIALR